MTRTARVGFALSLLVASIVPARAEENVIWDSWYTVTINKTVPYSYYREKVTHEKNNSLHFLNHVWKKEGEFINQEQLGAFAQADDAMSPLFFNFHSTYGTSETTIDGNVRNGQLTVKIKKGEQELPLVTKSMPKGTMFSVFFPVWLGKKLATFKEGQPQSFATILEDNLDIGFSTVSGSARLEKADDIAKKTKTRKFAVNYHDIRTYWWVDGKGMATRIEMPEQNMIVEKVSQEKAEAFLK